MQQHHITDFAHEASRQKIWKVASTIDDNIQKKLELWQPLTMGFFLTLTPIWSNLTPEKPNAQSKPTDLDDATTADSFPFPFKGSDLSILF